MTDQTPLIIIAIYLRGNSLDPKSVTNALGINPSRSQKRGDLRSTSTNHKVISKIGLWGLVSQSKAVTVPEHIEEVLANFDGRVISLRDISGVEEAYLYIYVACKTEVGVTENVELTVTKVQIDRLSGLGLDLRITVSSGPD